MKGDPIKPKPLVEGECFIKDKRKAEAKQQEKQNFK